MKQILILLTLFFGLSYTIQAQTQKMPTAAELTTKDVNELAERLKMTATQKSIAYNYTFDMYKMQMDLVKKQQAGTSSEDEVSKFYRFQIETKANIRKILKEDQLLEYEKLLDDRMNGETSKKKKSKKKKDKEEE